ncbi:peptidase S45 family protein [Sphingomonas changbaiensis NBRC 104936]|uniref:Peptidase S45 family protein n=1 Tax=Sphingomonas changbaiensis NBRC 104936 TaxID=1219043 RepID=A0A0E9MRV3_9SPHN|nr:penicillin acylase family protein [Sphingomonas changbaiensis]GAO40294.1 peptidase S45 family protein [Sphingomonas changbaiensis NBRC 104936]
MLTLALLLAAAAPQSDLARLQAEAAHVTITRDDWGIAHVRGRSDADAVFGAIYAQAEDDFNRVERNYLIALGRQAEADGEEKIWDDLRARLYVDEATLRAAYARSPKPMQALMNAWADGLNYYLATHPEVKPKAIARFEPWMALSFTEGSIGGDIERIDLDQLRAFYGGKPPAIAQADTGEKEPSGSNGFAIAPALSADGHALLLINPHTSFFFRSELQMTSDEGLNAYGASTWGQFFIYQGFNPHIGWMHTSSGVDVVDEFAETIERKGSRLFYRYGGQLRPVETRVITVRYRTPDGGTAARSFTTYRTHHGPIVRDAKGKWIAFAMMFKPVEALQQSWLRTKADDFASFLQIAELKANSSNNTIFADDKGEIAYLHPQFVPMRDNRFDYTKPVDGSDPATDWKGLTPLAQLPHVVSPPNGWVMNTNNWPYSAAGENSPRQADFPRYMDTFGENPRGIHATMLLKDRRDFTLPLLLDSAFDSYLPAFARLIPTLVQAYDGLPAGDPLKAKLKGQIALLRTWDYRWGIASQPTSLAVFWGEALWKDAKAPAEAEGVNIYDFMADRTTPKQKLQALAEASDQLERDFGHWGVAWGEINRFQRLTGDIVQPFNDKAPSIPVPFTSSRWGSLASFGAKAYPGTKRWYGTSGNSFVAVIDFGPKVRARAITAGGESGHPESPHFNDEAERYTTGNFREVYFWPDQLKGHTERVYRPGE